MTMKAENEFERYGHRIMMRDIGACVLSERTGLSEFAADEISFLFFDIMYTPKTKRAIKTMLDIAAEKNAREGLDDPSGLSLFSKRRSANFSASNNCGYASGGFNGKDGEQQILRTALELITEKDEAEKLAAELAERFGTSLSVYDARMLNANNIGIKSGVGLRLSMLIYIFLWNGKRGLTVRNRAEASRFFGEIYLGGGSDGTVVGYLDGDYRLIDVARSETESVIDKKQASAFCENGKNLGAKYMIAARRHRDEENNEYFDFTSKTADFMSDAERNGLKLLDFIIYKRNSYFALKDGALAPDAKAEYDEFLY